MTKCVTDLWIFRQIGVGMMKTGHSSHWYPLVSVVSCTTPDVALLTHKQWLSKSPARENPMDYSLWVILGDYLWSQLRLIAMICRIDRNLALICRTVKTFVVGFLISHDRLERARTLGTRARFTSAAGRRGQTEPNTNIGGDIAEVASRIREYENISGHARARTPTQV